MTISLASTRRQYGLITANYWAFTLTDGALRMLVVLHFHQLGYSALGIAFLFLFYELFGVITNLVGGWLGARLGLNKTMNIGLALQILALSMLLVPADLLTVAWVMSSQALSGIAKDLNKMSAKSSIKLLVADDQQQTLYRWVAILTGSKNTLKGVGFFLGAILLALVGFKATIVTMTSALTLVWLASLLLLKKELGKAKTKPKFTQLFSKNNAINTLAAARLFLFGARDIWFVVALPVYLVTAFQWSFWQVGSFLALWIIGYGGVQTIAPIITKKTAGKIPDGATVFHWACLLAFIPALIAAMLMLDIAPKLSVIVGLLFFGGLFAINSSLHSFLIVSYADRNGVSLDVGFYYMANAMGRLFGTLLSGWIFQVYGFVPCLLLSTLFIIIAAGLSSLLPTRE